MAKDKADSRVRSHWSAAFLASAAASARDIAEMLQRYSGASDYGAGSAAQASALSAMLVPGEGRADSPSVLSLLPAHALLRARSAGPDAPWVSLHLY